MLDESVREGDEEGAAKTQKNSLEKRTFSKDQERIFPSGWWIIPSVLVGTALWIVVLFGLF